MKTILGIAFVLFGFVGIFSPYMIKVESVELHYFLSSLSVIVGVGFFYDRWYSYEIRKIKEQRKLSDNRVTDLSREYRIIRAKLRGTQRAFDNLSIQKRRIDNKLQETTARYHGTELMIKDLVDETLCENQKLQNQITGLKLTIARYKKHQNGSKREPRN